MKSNTADIFQKPQEMYSVMVSFKVSYVLIS